MSSPGKVLFQSEKSPLSLRLPFLALGLACLGLAITLGADRLTGTDLAPFGTTDAPLPFFVILELLLVVLGLIGCTAFLAETRISVGADGSLVFRNRTLTGTEESTIPRDRIAGLQLTTRRRKQVQYRQLWLQLSRDSRKLLMQQTDEEAAERYLKAFADELGVPVQRD